MKNKFKKLFPILSCSLLLFASCGEEHNFTPYITNTSVTNANVKFINVAIGSDNINFSLDWFVNGNKVTGTSGFYSDPNPYNPKMPSGISYGMQYPASIGYASIMSGKNELRAETPPKYSNPQTEPIVRFTESFTTESQKFYSAFAIGNSGKYKNYFIEDDFSIISNDIDKSYIRFVNTIADTPTEGYDILIQEVNNGNVLFSGIGYLKPTKFVPIKTVDNTSSTNYYIKLYPHGIITKTAIDSTKLLFRKGRAYTVFSRGLASSKINSNKPKLSTYTNY